MQKQIDEVMWLMNTLAHTAYECGAHGISGHEDEAEKNWRQVKLIAETIESKLRELLEETQ